jgi:hypothetical protein
MTEDKPLLIEPHYLGSLEYFSLLLRHKKIIWEVHEHFRKQTYRNRCYILGPNGSQLLSVPVVFGNRTAFRDVRIDFSQSWIKDHVRAVQSAYGKAAYFDHFFDLYLDVWKGRPEFLLDLNEQMMTICLKILQVDIMLVHSESFEKVPEIDLIDARNEILAKRPFSERNFYRPVPYFQNFGADFVPNLSLLDVLMCEGIHSLEIINRSRF